MKKDLKYLITFGLLIFAIFILVGCDGKRQEKELSVTKQTITLQIREEEIIALTIKPEDAVIAVEVDKTDIISAILTEANLKINALKNGDAKVILKHPDEEVDDVVIEVTVKDTTKPVISGVSDANVMVGVEYTVVKAIVTDNIDTNLTATYTVKDPNGATVEVVNDKFTCNKVGVYRITYKAEDKSGNKANDLVIEVTVKDEVKPVISGVSDANVMVGVEYTVVKAIVTDNIDTNLTATYTVKDPNGATVEVVNDKFTCNKVGVYRITYKAEDKSGNKANDLVIEVTVKDEVKPVISGVSDANVMVGVEYTVVKAIVTDNIDTNLTATYTVKDPNGATVEVVNDKFTCNKVGVYRITYKAEDKSGNKADDLVIEVTVKDEIAPIITASIESGSLVAQGDMIGFTFEDNYTIVTAIIHEISLLLNGESVIVEGLSYQFLEFGTYEFTVTAQDEALNKTTQTYKYYLMDEKEMCYFESEINMPAADGLHQELNYNLDYVSEGKSSLKATVAKGQEGWPGLNFDSTYFEKAFNKTTIDLTQYFNLSMQVYNASSDVLALTILLKDVEGKKFEGATVYIESQSWGEIRINPNDIDINGIDKTQIDQIRFFLTCANHPQLEAEDLIFYVDTVQLSKESVYMDFDGKGSLHKIKPIFENQGALMELIDAETLDRSRRVLKYSHKVGPSELIAFTYALNAGWADKLLSFRDLEGYSKLEFDVYATAPGFNISFRIIYSDWTKHWSPNYWPNANQWGTYSIDISTLDQTKLKNIRGIEFYINYAGDNTTERQVIYFDNFRLVK